MKLDTLENLAGQKILILGLGKEGLITAKYLAKHLPSGRFGLADQKGWESYDQETRDFISNSGRFDLHLGPDYLDCLEDYQLVIKSPGINPRLDSIIAAKEAGVIFTSPTRIFFANKQGKVVGVTGSKGKSTTASLIYSVLRAGGLDVELVGNIGRGALEYLEQDSPEKVFVFEMSSYQLEDFDGSPEVAVLVSFFPEHLDYHGSLENYFAAKMKLIDSLPTDAKVVYNAGAEEIAKYVQNFPFPPQKRVELIPFNDGVKSKVEEAAAWLSGAKLVGLEEIKLKGEHNLQNMLAAAAVGQIFGLPLETIRQALRVFRGLEHRLELVGQFKGVTFYNDAISTTPESTIAGLEALAKEKLIGTIIVGGLDRGYKFEKLALKILNLDIKNVLIFPATGPLIWREIETAAALKKGKPLPSSYPVNNMEEAVKTAYRVTPADSICLLSNASPSYNLFKNFEDKGRQFKEWIVKLNS